MSHINNNNKESPNDTQTPDSIFEWRRTQKGGSLVNRLNTQLTICSFTVCVL